MLGLENDCLCSAGKDLMGPITPDGCRAPSSRSSESVQEQGAYLIYEQWLSHPTLLPACFAKCFDHHLQPHMRN